MKSGEKKRGVNRLLWFERYVASDPNVTARRNAATLEKIVGKGRAWAEKDTLSSDYQEDAPGEVMLAVDTPDEAKFKRALGMVVSMRGDVLGDIYEFVFKGKTRVHSWNAVEKIAG